MRTTFLALAGLITLAATGCKIDTTDDSITFKTQPKFVEDNVKPAGDQAPWAGEQVVVDVPGPSATFSGGGIGIKVQYDSAATTITASARIVAYADKEDEPSARQSIVDVKSRFAITTAGGITKISCQAGDTHNTSKAGQSGCEYIIVTLPGGSSAKPISVKALSGNGDITIAGKGTISGAVEANAQNGDIDVTMDANLGSSVAVKTANGDVTLHLPSNFAADKIDLVADGAGRETDIDTTAFPDVKNGAGRGQAGTGATRIAAESETLGKVTLGL